MGYVGIALGVGAVVLLLIYVVRARRKANTTNDGMLPIFGLGVVFYNTRNVSSGDAAIIAAKLRTVKEILWPMYEEIHDAKVKCTLSKIFLRPQLPKPAQGSVSKGPVFINPDKDYERAFGAELLNYFRAELHGPGHVYCIEAVDNKDRAMCQKATALWRAYGESHRTI